MLNGEESEIRPDLESRRATLVKELDGCPPISLYEGTHLSELASLQIRESQEYSRFSEFSNALRFELPQAFGMFRPFGKLWVLTVHNCGAIQEFILDSLPDASIAFRIARVIRGEVATEQRRQPMRIGRQFEKRDALCAELEQINDRLESNLRDEYNQQSKSGGVNFREFL